MKDLILTHFRKYPKMQIEDYVKLIYQHTFGGNHLVKDEEASLSYLKKEYETVEKYDEELLEDIGNGLVRVNLHSYKGDIEKLNQNFVLSSSIFIGSLKEFEDNLEDFIELVSSNQIPLNKDDVLRFLKSYKEAGYPPISHSKEYKEAYSPSYRVVLKSMLHNFRVGFLGASKIGEKMARAINMIDGFSLYGVSARSSKRANEYKEKWGFEKAYESYEDMLKDPNIDLVYLSTIHSVHYEELLLCLKYHKPVLCEKSLTLSYKDTKDIYERFEKENLFLAEALMTSFLPARHIINDYLFKEKIIGDIKKINTYFTADIKDVDRVVKKELGGGALYDIGIYALTEIFRLLGFEYDSMELLDYVYEDVDLYEVVKFKYKDIEAVSLSDVRITDRWDVEIHGTKGKMIIDSISLPKHLTIKYNNGNTQEIDLPPHHGGFRYELAASKDAIFNHKYESALWSHEDSIKTAKCINDLLDLMRK